MLLVAEVEANEPLGADVVEDVGDLKGAKKEDACVNYKALFFFSTDTTHKNGDDLDGAENEVRSITKHCICTHNNTHTSTHK